MTSKDLRHQAWNALRGNWGWAILAFLVASVLGGAHYAANFQINVENESNVISFNGLSLPVLAKYFENPDTAAIAIAVTVIVVSVVLFAFLFSLAYTVAWFCLSSIITVGYAHFNMDVIDGEKIEFVRIFSKFKDWKRVILANLIRSLFIFLWSLLFIIPGIIAAYRYSIVPFILIDNPDMSAGDAIDYSKLLMHGNKWRLFCLEFSFNGWDILCMLTFGILNI
jgi:uncharacterized membrane protein